MDQDFINTLVELREKEALKFVEDRLNGGEDPLNILDDARRAVEVVGKRFADGKYFIPELIYSGEILKAITERVKPKMARGRETKRLGKVIIGTVAGDIHDIGKDIVVFMLDVNGFEVVDLGIDVPAERFVDAIKASGSRVVGLSGFLTLTFQSMKDTVEAIKEAGLRDRVKIMIGGGQIDEQVRIFSEADAYGRDAMTAVTLAKAWIGG